MKFCRQVTESQFLDFVQFIIIHVVDIKPILYERDWLLPAWCLYPQLGVCRVPLVGRSFKQMLMDCEAWGSYKKRRSNC